MDIKKVSRGIAMANSASMLAEQVLLPKEVPELNINEADVEVHVPTLNEELYIEDTLLSIDSQRLVREGEVGVILVDSGSEDDTVEVAEDYVDEIMQVPKGKLTARNVAAEESDADIMVYVDAGDIYPRGWLDQILLPFNDPNVVATYGPKFNRSKIYKTWSVLSNVVYYGSALPGNNHALHRETFIETGMFDEGIDQKSMFKMVKEEEFDLMKRMKEYGEVVFVPKASMQVSSRTMPISTEKTEDFVRQKKEGVRF